MENLISITSTFVPMIGSILFNYYPSVIWEASGCAIIGSIQIICGIQLIKNNARGLIGFRVDTKTMDKLNKTIAESPYLDEVTETKGTFTSEMEYRVEAKSSYDLDRLTEDILANSKEAIVRLMYARTPESRYYYILEIMENTPKIIFKQIQKNNANLEELLRAQNPDIAEIDIDTDHPDLLHWDELDRVKIVEELNFNGVQDYARNWMDSVVGGILGTNYTRQVKIYGITKITEKKMRNH